MKKLIVILSLIAVVGCKSKKAHQKVETVKFGPEPSNKETETLRLGEVIPIFEGS